MHEYSLVQSLMERIQAEASARNAVAVHRVRVKIGEMSGVEAELLAGAFDIVRDGTLCAAATLEVVSVPARWACSGCAAPIEAGAILRCPACGKPARLLSGDEILLDQIEMEVP